MDESQTFRIPMLPLAAPRDNWRRISQSSSCAPMLAKYEIKKLQNSTKKKVVSGVSSSNNVNSMSIMGSSIKGAALSVKSPAMSVNPPLSSLISAAASPASSVSAPPNSAATAASPMADPKWIRRSRTLSAPTAALNEKMTKELKKLEVAEWTKTKTFTTQPDEDGDDAGRGLRPDSPTFDSTTAPTINADGTMISSLSFDSAALAREADQRRMEANELLEQCAQMVAVLAPERVGFDRDSHVREDEAELEAQRQKALEWERRNKMIPLGDDMRDFSCPKKWSTRRRVDAKLEFFRNESTGAMSKLQERVVFYKQCDRELTQSSREGVEYRQAKMFAFIHGQAPPPRPPSSARPQSARSWPEELKRRQAGAAGGGGGATSSSVAPTGSNTTSPTAAVAASSVAESAHQLSPSTGGTAAPSGGAPSSSPQSTSAQQSQQQQQQQQPQHHHHRGDVSLASAAAAAFLTASVIPPAAAQLSDALLSRRPQSARVPSRRAPTATINSQMGTSGKNSGPNTTATTTLDPSSCFAAGLGFSASNMMMMSMSSTSDLNADERGGSGGWVSRNYSDHAIPLVELPPRDAAHWHARNDAWFARAMRHRGEKTRLRAFEEHERNSRAFFQNRSEEQLRGTYGTPASGAVIPRPLSARSTQTAVTRFNTLGRR